jgi:hypothetical protein
LWNWAGECENIRTLGAVSRLTHALHLAIDNQEADD